MQIIDKQKDFYDFYSHIYGLDKSVTFDRRGSIIVDDTMLYADHYLYPRGYSFFKDPASAFHLLEVGCVQYIIQMDGVKRIGDKWGQQSLNFDACRINIFHKYNEHKHFSKKAIGTK